MSTTALAFGTSAIYVLSFDSAGVELTSTRTIDSADDFIIRAEGPGALAPGNQRVYFQGSRSGPRYLCYADIEDGVIGSIEQFSTGNQYNRLNAIAFTADGLRMLTAHANNFSNDNNVYLWDVSGDSPTLLDSYSAVSTTATIGTCAHVGGNRFVVASNTATGQELIDITGDTITEIAAPGIDEGSGGTYAAFLTPVSPNRFVSVFSTLRRLVSVANDEFESIAVLSGASGSGLKASNNYVWQNKRLAQVVGDTVVAVDTFTGRLKTWVDPALSLDGTLALFISQVPNDRAVLYQLTGSTVSQIDTLDVATEILHFAGEFLPLSGLPPTPAQIFQNTFAEVSGRDPLPTALNQRTPARSLANYNISMYLFNPQIIRKPVQIELGELHLTNPAPDGDDIARLMWFDADDRDPHFVIGRWAQVIGRSGTADPGTVELELRICDNPESFIPPS